MTCASRLALVVVLVTGVARADDADQLFRDGRAHLRAGHIAEACTSFQKSFELEPAYGTLLNLGDCSEKLGRTASAWRAFKRAAELGSAEERPDRIELPRARALALEPRLCRLRVVLQSDTPLSVTLDGQALATRELGEARPVDPGTHVVGASAPGRRPSEVSVEVSRPGQTEVVTLGPLLADEALDAAPSRFSTRRVAGLAITGGGAAALAAGAYFGITAFSRWSDATAECGARGCTPRGLALGDDARSAATWANITVGTGLVAVAAGLILYFTAPAAAPSTAPGGVAVHF
jgi:hypothetical protein